jgi:hypothetical protein
VKILSEGKERANGHFEIEEQKEETGLDGWESIRSGCCRSLLVPSHSRDYKSYHVD